MHQPVFTICVCTQTRTRFWYAPTGIHHPRMHTDSYCFREGDSSCDCSRGSGIHQPVFTICVCTQIRTALGWEQQLKTDTAVVIAHEVLVFTNRYSPSACAHRFVLLWDGNSS
jgi:hypothetical protein